MNYDLYVCIGAVTINDGYIYIYIFINYFIMLVIGWTTQKCEFLHNKELIKALRDFVNVML